MSCCGAVAALAVHDVIRKFGGMHEPDFWRLLGRIEHIKEHLQLQTACVVAMVMSVQSLLAHSTKVSMSMGFCDIRYLHEIQPWTRNWNVLVDVSFIVACKLCLDRKFCIKELLAIVPNPPDLATVRQVELLLTSSVSTMTLPEVLVRNRVKMVEMLPIFQSLLPNLTHKTRPSEVLLVYSDAQLREARARTFAQVGPMSRVTAFATPAEAVVCIAQGYLPDLVLIELASEQQGQPITLKQMLDEPNNSFRVVSMVRMAEQSPEKIELQLGAALVVLDCAETLTESQVAACQIRGCDLVIPRETLGVHSLCALLDLLW
mmetsp:Transcript_45188/g.94188  ORF Transcript_45188/g.94188 Transcript_45188/m.94188 type:complete len:318 (-) Transcript_45188:284-1237(-)